MDQSNLNIFEFVILIVWFGCKLAYISISRLKLKLYGQD